MDVFVKSIAMVMIHTHQRVKSFVFLFSTDRVAALSGLLLSFYLFIQRIIVEFIVFYLRCTSVGIYCCYTADVNNYIST